MTSLIASLALLGVAAFFAICLGAAEEQGKHRAKPLLVLVAIVTLCFGVAGLAQVALS